MKHCFGVGHTWAAFTTPITHSRSPGTQVLTSVSRTSTSSVRGTRAALAAASAAAAAVLSLYPCPCPCPWPARCWAASSSRWLTSSSSVIFTRW